MTSLDFASFAGVGFFLTFCITMICLCTKQCCGPRDPVLPIYMPKVTVLPRYTDIFKEPHPPVYSSES